MSDVEWYREQAELWRSQAALLRECIAEGRECFRCPECENYSSRTEVNWLLDMGYTPYEQGWCKIAKYEDRIVSPYQQQFHTTFCPRRSGIGSKPYWEHEV